MGLLRCRKNVALLDDTELFAFRDAVFRLHEQGRYQKYVALHADVSDLGHFGPAFLPWHRVLLREFELELQSIDPTVMLPYWDFAVANPSIWRDDFFGRDGAVQLTWTGQDGLQRSWNIARDTFSADSVATTSVDDLIDEDDYRAFRGPLENGQHGAAHGWLGIPGDQQSFATAVNDPFFFLLHCNVDRIWAMWQERKRQKWMAANPGAPYPATQLAVDYHWSGNSPATTYELQNPTNDRGANTPPARHNLDNPMWPWDGSSDGVTGAPATEPWASAPVVYRPGDTLDHRAFGSYIFDSHSPIVVKETNTVSFNDIPEGEETVRAIVFYVESCRPVHFTVVSGPSVTDQTPASSSPEFRLPLGNTVESESPHGAGHTKARIWVSYKGTDEGDAAAGEITVRCEETGEEWVVPITANTVRRPTVGVVLLLDKSGSMDHDSGDGRKRIDVLHSAATTFADVIQDENGIGIASFAVSTSVDMPVADVGGAFGGGRSTARQTILAHQPLNEKTSIGNGLEEASGMLSGVNQYDSKAIVVLTDGHENEPKWIADVAGDILDEFVYAIGLGTVEQIKPAALNALVSGTGGFLEMTGNMSVDDQFRLEKYYLQILAAVTNTDIVVDPQDRILPGQVHRLPFTLNETDISTDMILLCRLPEAISFMIETPKGDLIDPGTAVGLPGVVYRQGDEVAYYRVTLPVPVGSSEAASGTWHAVLHLDRKRWHSQLKDLVAKLSQEEIQSVLTHGVEYSFNVHALSNLRMRPTLTQTGYEPGATMTLRAVLTEYGLPLGPLRATLIADLTRPDGTTGAHVLTELEPGVFEASIVAHLAGLYRFRLRATGTTLRGRQFERDMLLTAGVHTAGDQPPPSGDPDRPNERLCELLKCLLSDRVFGKCLRECGVDLELLRRCLERYCRGNSGPTQQTLRTALQAAGLSLGEPHLARVMKIVEDTIP